MEKVKEQAETSVPITPKNKSREVDDWTPEGLEGPVSDTPPLNADQYLMAWADNQAKLILIEELKAPHKLTQPFLVLGLTDPNTAEFGKLNVKKIRDRQRSGDTAEQKVQFDAQLLVTAAATQTYAYMLPAGLAYGCIVTGEAIVFLHIDEAHPCDLRYHVAIPSRDVLPSDGETPNWAYSAIAQLVTFSILASETEQYSRKWRNDAMKKALIWEVDYAAVERALKTPRNERRGKWPEQSSEWKGRLLPFEPKSHKTRSKRHDKKDDDDDDDDDGPPSGRQSGSESSDAFVEFDDTPSKTNRSQGTKGNGQGTRGTSRSQAPRHSAYCTQACLLGLVRRSAIDIKCPNAALHPRNLSDPTLHLIDREKFRILVQDQLSQTLDDYITDLRISGARGMLFQITLASHGYVFVGKGTVDVFVSDLKHEGRMYERLDSLQGTDIPVYLGNVDLVKLKWYDYCLCVVHMMLLSYAGEQLSHLGDAMDMQVNEFRSKLSQFGVQHGDLRGANMLWNEELQRLLFIDFERSTVLPRRRKITKAKTLHDVSANTQLSPTRALQEISTNTQWSPSKTSGQKLPEPESLPKSMNALLSSKGIKAPATFSIFGDENMSSELPVPSPKCIDSPQRLTSPKRLYEWSVEASSST
ncbi:MAG: hypothetical protein Q9196_004432 [Gyalolechia fulgens]